MAVYRLRYTFNVDLVPPGIGPIGSPQVGPGNANAQTLGLINQPGAQNITGSGTSGVIAAADITTLTNAAATDMAAQLNLAVNLAKMQGWPTGNP
jgi:hypothetical protein